MANIKQEIQNYLRQPENDNQVERAKLILYILKDCIYDFVKNERPEGFGLDGKNGPERQGIAQIVDSAENYYYDALEHQLRDR